jgi:hypothetical protein
MHGIALAGRLRRQSKTKNLDHRIDIENEHGQVLDTVWFKDVVSVEGSER